MSAALLAAAGRAQQGLPYDLVQVIASPDSSPAGAFGVHMLAADFNHDGFTDLLASNSLATAGGLGGAGKAFILFGPTLTNNLGIAAQSPTLAENMGRDAVAIGDVNADGELDILLGSPGYDAGGGINDDYGRAHLFLGPAYTTDIVFDDVVPEAHAGFGSGATLADLDGDGFDDVVVSAPGKTIMAGQTALANAGEIRVWNATNLHGPPALISFPKPMANAYFGSYLARVPSQTGPGDDLLASAPTLITSPCMNCQGKVFRFHTPGTVALGVINPPNQVPFAYNFGHFLSTSDIDGDGSRDLFIGAPDAVEQAFVYLGPAYVTPAVSLVSPEGTAASGFGGTGAAADLDADGHIDLLLGDPFATLTQGLVRIYWGPGFTSMDELAQAPGLGFGSSVATADVDGDGFDEIFAQSPGGGSGVIWQYRRSTLQPSSSEITISTGSSIAFTLDLGSAHAGNLYLGALSTAAPGSGLILGPGSFLPLQPDAMTFIGLSLLGTPILQDFTGTLDSQGHAAFTLNWPAGKGGSLAGKTLHVSAITATAGGVLSAGSNDVELTISH